MAKTPTEIRSLARAHTDSAMRVLTGIMNEPTAPHAARVAAAIHVMDRGWGKAVQHIGTIRRDASTLSDHELADIAAGRGEGADSAPVHSQVTH